MSKSEAIKVAFRLRPLNSKEKHAGRKVCCVALEDEGVIEMQYGASCKRFTFDAVFSESSSQRRIYGKSLKVLIVFSLRSNTHNTFRSRCLCRPCGAISARGLQWDRILLRPNWRRKGELFLPSTTLRSPIKSLTSHSTCRRIPWREASSPIPLSTFLIILH